MIPDRDFLSRRELMVGGASAAGALAGFGGGPSRLKANGLGWVDVKDFGAVGDGAVDDRAAIVRAANAAAAVAGPATLYFPAGTYLMNDGQPPELGDNVTAVGEGAASILKRGPATSYFGLLVNKDYRDNSVGAERVAVVNLTFDANGANQDPPYSQFRHCVALIGVKDAVIRGCRFVNLSGDGVYVGSTIDGVARVNASQHIRIVDNVFDGNSRGRNGISIIHGRNIVISHNNFMNVAADDHPGAIDLEPDKPHEDIRGVSIVGNTFDGCRRAVHAYGTRGATVSGLVFSGNSVRGSRGNAAGVGLIDIDDVTITGNLVSETEASGIRLQDSAHAIVSNNSVANSGIVVPAPGFWMTNCPQIVICGNVVHHSRGDAYRIDGCTMFAFTSNSARQWDSDSTGRHYGIRGTNGSVGGILTGNAFDGQDRRRTTVLVTESRCSDWNVSNNLFRNVEKKFDLTGRNRVQAYGN